MSRLGWVKVEWGLGQDGVGGLRLVGVAWVGVAGVEVGLGWVGGL